MSWLERMTKPEYVMQPRQLLRRLRGQVAARGADGMYTLPLPWGLDLRVQRLERVALAVDVLGVHDLVVTEAIWRLVAPGDTVIDVGANVGYMTLAMVSRLAGSGHVLSFEPQPGVLDDLAANVAAARARFPGVTVDLHPVALSEAEGTASLQVPPESTEDRGSARLGPADAGVAVATRRLDDFAAAIRGDVSLVKIDVEGHEPAVLRGATKLLESRRLRNVIIEEHERYPTASTLLLERFGYTIFSLERSLMKVRLGDPRRAHRVSWEAPSLLATLAPGPVARAFHAPGWRALR
jgi:FkbM family methyltransferase